MTTNFVLLGKELNSVVEDLNKTVESKNRLAAKASRLRKELDSARSHTSHNAHKLFPGLSVKNGIIFIHIQCSRMLCSQECDNSSVL